MCGVGLHASARPTALHNVDLGGIATVYSARGNSAYELDERLAFYYIQ